MFEKTENHETTYQDDLSVFVYIYANDCTPYKKYLEPHEEFDESCEEYDGVPDKNQIVPMVLMALRWDGTFGAIGGKVNKGENKYRALDREVEEEIGYKIPHTSSLDPILTLRDGNKVIQSFAYRVDYWDLKEIQRRAYDAKHSQSEVSGVNLIHLIEYENGKGISSFWWDKRGAAKDSQDSDI